MQMITVYHLQEILLMSLKIRYKKEWFRKNYLVANPAKFQTMLVISNNIKDTEFNVTADNVSIPSSDTMKVLGIDTDDRLIFDGHISNMCIKAGKQLNALQRLKCSLDQDAAWQYIRDL